MLCKNWTRLLRLYYRWFYCLVVLLLVVYVYVVAMNLFQSSEISSFEKSENELKDREESKGEKLVDDNKASPSGIFVESKLERNKNVEEFRRNRFEMAQQRSKDINGPGEDGLPVVLTQEEQKEADRVFGKETYNVVASKKIAMDRRLPDIRHPDCRTRAYPKDLPMASVVVIFCNEAPSGLLRTIHSVVNRSPPQYLREVILIDDLSDRPDLGASLEEYLAGTWSDGIVRLVRSKKRLGLIRAKIWGAELSSGEVIVFLDAHCEATDYWLEPILARIKEKPNVVVCPAVDSINDKTLEYSRNGGISVGGFTWSLHFTWRTVPEKEKLVRKSEADPVRSPTMAGGLLAANKEFFFKIGAYDPGMFTWGGENLELSFRAWMCGGELEFIPCSRVGHVFRAGHPYVFDHKDSHGYNSKRLAEVWMDDYKRLFYNHRRDLLNSEAGFLEGRRSLKRSLNCKSFKWYLDTVFPEQFIIDENSQAYGRVRNLASNLCLDSMSRNVKEKPNIGLYFCSTLSNNQMFGLSKLNELRMEEVCTDSLGKEGSTVKLFECHEMKGNQEWHYNHITKKLIHASGFCMDAGVGSQGSDVLVSVCNESDNQKWEFEHIIKFL